MPSDYPTPPLGSASDPMPGAKGPNIARSLTPDGLALGQIVPYEVEIAVTGDTSREEGIIDFTCLWSTITTNGDNFGFDPSYKVDALYP